MPSLPTAAVIGAGSSGIAAAKALHERGVPFTCFEASDRVGGNWVFANKNGMSAAYRELFINTSRERMEYSDYPMPKSYPDFPHHTQIAAYFDAYDVASKRHTIQVDFDDYLHALGKERPAGAERARRQGFTLPVAARAVRAQVPA
jgi:cation diffusion facilitator CzcD-associated flavoprotein CzcO